LIFKAMGFPTDMFPVLFAIPRVVGWLAHWLESLSDPETKIYRPYQKYVGKESREYVNIKDRKSEVQFATKEVYSSMSNVRRQVVPQDNKQH